MDVVDDIVDYLRNLRKGFDKVEFDNNISELGRLVEKTGLEPDDFHTLVKIWLNLTIPITKWRSLGDCLVPGFVVESGTIDYITKWLLSQLCCSTNVLRSGYILEWLSALLDYKRVQEEILNEAYELYYSLFIFERNNGSGLSLLCRLTKPEDVSRWRTLQLIDQLNNINTGKAKSQVLVLLGLFKSLRPECVPEPIPAISAQSTFRKKSSVFEKRLKNLKARLGSGPIKQLQKLEWNTMIMGKVHSKNAAPLVPGLELVKLRSDTDKSKIEKSYFDFMDAGSLLAYSARHSLRRPARLRSLLCNDAAATLLAAHTAHHRFLHEDLAHILAGCFLIDDKTYKYVEKEDLLCRLSYLQNIMMSPVPAVSQFLADYLLLWSGREHFQTILSLLEWVEVQSFEDLYSKFLQPLEHLSLGFVPLRRAYLMRCLTQMYLNMLFLDNLRRNEDLADVINGFSDFLSDFCTKSVQAYPSNVTVLGACACVLERLAAAEVRGGRRRAFTVPGPLLPAALLAAPAPAMLDKMAALILRYREMVISLKKSGMRDRFQTKIQLVKEYKQDMANALWYESPLVNRNAGCLFRNMGPALIQELSTIKGIDKGLSVRNHYALIAFTHLKFAAYGELQWLEIAIKPEFESLGAFLELL